MVGSLGVLIFAAKTMLANRHFFGFGSVFRTALDQSTPKGDFELGKTPFVLPFRTNASTAEDENKHNNHAQNLSKSCSFVSAKNTTNKPIWVPSYPGSGSEMLRELVQASTGLFAGDFYNHECWENAATCKTHWPTLQIENPEEPREQVKRMYHRYVALVRNPMNALPSYFNYVWEYNNGLRDHSIQGDEQEWRIYRDSRIVDQLDAWKQLFIAWDQQPYELAFYLPFEQLIDSVQGPKMLRRLVDEFRSAGFEVAPDEDISCLWYRVVKEGEVKQGKYSTKRTHKYMPGYTKEQKQMILNVLDEVKTLFSNRTELVELMDEYIADVMKNTRIDVSSMSNSTSSSTSNIRRGQERR